jgi:hypothetical protein
LSVILIWEVRIYYQLAATPSHERKISDMKQNENNANDSGETLAQKVVNALRKSGCEAWLGCPPPEDLERLKVEKAERDALGLRKWLEAKDRRREELKQRAKRILKGECDYE